jgi:hypothetical protein
MYKSLALVLTIVLIGIGAAFLALDILDIAEGYKYSFPVAFTNTVFITLLAVPILYFTIRGLAVNRLPEIVALNLAVFSFGFSILLYGWFTGLSLNARLVSYDSGIFLASIFHIIGMNYGKTGFDKTRTGSNVRFWAVCVIYVQIAILIGLITWLGSLNFIDVTGTIIGNIGIRDVFHAVAVLLMLVTVFVFIKTYLKQHVDFYYWYLLGLVLLASGVFFISIGQLEGRVAWAGRVCQYVSSIYFLAAAVYSGKKRKQQKRSDEYQLIA